MIAVANFISLPLLFLSTTMLARSQMPHWMRVAARFNPVNWGVKAARAVVLPDTDWGVGRMATSLLLLALTAVTAGLGDLGLPLVPAHALSPPARSTQIAWPVVTGWPTVDRRRR